MLRNLMMSSSIAAVIAALGIGLAGCKPGDDAASAQTAPPPLAALPLTNAAVPPSAPAPLAASLPRARPARVGRVSSPYDQYAYLDRAYDMNDAFADAPPDYAFDEEDQVSPWVWRTDDGWTRVVEPLPDGDRYYYYGPGADYPFLVRDPDYSYGYSGDELVVIYDSGGRPLPDYEMERQSDYAGRFLVRAQLLYGLAQQDRRPVAEVNWQARQARLISEADDWRRAQSQQADWRAYHDSHARQEQAHWAPEMYRRDAEAARFARQVNNPVQAQRDLAAAKAAAQVARANHVQLVTSAPRPAPGERRPAFAAGGDQAAGPAGAGVAPGQPPFRGDRRAAQDLAQSQAAQQARQQQFAQSPANHQVLPEADRQAQLQAQQQARQQQLASLQAQRQVRLQTQQQAHQQELAAAQANRQAQAEAERQARIQAQQQAHQQQLASLEAQRQARLQTQQQAHQQELAAAQASRQAQAEAERQARIQAQQQAHQQQLASLEAQRQARIQAQQQAHQQELAAAQANRQAQAEAERQARLQAQQQAHQQQLASLEAQRQARLQTQQQAHQQQIAAAQANRLAQAQAERLAKLQAQQGDKSKPKERDKSGGQPPAL